MCARSVVRVRLWLLFRLASRNLKESHTPSYRQNTTSSEVYITSDYSLTYDNVRDYIRRGKALGVGTMIRLFNAVEDMSGPQLDRPGEAWLWRGCGVVLACGAA